MVREMGGKHRPISYEVKFDKKAPARLLQSLEKPQNEGQMLLTANKDKFKSILKMTGEELIPEPKYYTGAKRSKREKAAPKEDIVT